MQHGLACSPNLKQKNDHILLNLLDNVLNEQKREKMQDKFAVTFALNAYNRT